MRHPGTSSLVANQDTGGQCPGHRSSTRIPDCTCHNEESSTDRTPDSPDLIHEIFVPCASFVVSLNAIQKVLQQGMPLLSENGFRVELHTLDVVLTVTDTHDLVHLATMLGPGSHLEAVRQRLPFNHQRMVTGGAERVAEPGEHPDIGVVYRRGLAVHHLARMHDACAEGLADGLVSQTNPQDGQAPGKVCLLYTSDAADES